MPDKDVAARDLIAWHFSVAPEITEIYRVLSDREGERDEPIKLLEVDAAGLSADQLEPFLFGPSKDVPYPMLIASVTPNDLRRLRASLVGTEWDLTRAERHVRPAA